MDTASIVFCAALLAMSVLGHLLPRFTRPDVFFGVTVDPAFRRSDDAKRILQNYRAALWCSTVAAALILLSSHRPVIASVVYLVAIAWAQAASHRRVLANAASQAATIEVDLSAPVEQMPGGLIAVLLPFVALIGLGVWAVLHIDGLPGRLAVHWSFSGPNRWVNTSPRAIISLFLQHGFICLVLTAAALGVLHWSRRISAAGPTAAAERRFRRLAILLILTCEYFMILPPAFTVLQAPAVAMRIWLVALLIVLLGFVAVLMRAGQGGTRLVKTMGSVAVGDRTADEHWIWGMVYFNRADPALLVEKRMGVGWTVNFGNLWSWVLLAVIIAIPPIIRHTLR
jgi:uncharacterized membrane protein